MIYFWVVAKNTVVMNSHAVKEKQPDRYLRRFQNLFKNTYPLKFNLKGKKNNLCAVASRKVCISLESSIEELSCLSAALFKCCC